MLCKKGNPRSGTTRGGGRGGMRDVVPAEGIEPPTF